MPKGIKGFQKGHPVFAGAEKGWLKKGTLSGTPFKKGENCGEKNHMWKGGVTPLHHRRRKLGDMKRWRKAVLERDNFKCQKYGVSGGVLVAHHINSFAEFKELQTSIENGITLCEKAHREFHRLYGYKNNTKEQLEEYLAAGY